MAEQSKLVVVLGKKAVSNAAASVSQSAGALREATTGQVVTLPRVWAVAAPERVKDVVSTAVEKPVPAVEVSFYRKYTEGILHRYVQLTMEAGRVSSLMGREVLGGRASSYRIHGFDDAVIFRIDVEKCLKQLDHAEMDVIRRIAIQEYTHAEAADLMGLSLRTVGTRYGKAVDRLTRILLRTRLLEPMKACQEPFA